MLASSREPRAAANAPGGYGIRPYNGFSAGRASGLPMWPVVAGRHVGEGHAPPANPAPETRGLPGICGTYKMTVGRDALTPPHPAPPQTPAGGINPSPTNRNKRRGQRENNKPCDITNPCRGRCLHRPGNPAPPQTPAGGISGLRAAAARRLTSETRLRAQ